MDGRPLLFKRVCYARQPMSSWGHDLGRHRMLHFCLSRLPSGYMGIGVFLSLRPSIRRYRLTIHCRKAVYLARFLQCRDVMHLRVCSRGLRASVDPNATDFDWLVRICPEENVRRH